MGAQSTGGSRDRGCAAICRTGPAWSRHRPVPATRTARGYRPVTIRLALTRTLKACKRDCASAMIRFQPENATLVAVGQQVYITVRPLHHVANAVFHGNAVLGSHALAIQCQANQGLGRKTAD